MSCDIGVVDKKAVTLEELEAQLKEAKKGVAKIDKKYVNYDERGHLFDYDINFERFLDDINHILESMKK